MPWVLQCSTCYVVDCVRIFLVQLIVLPQSTHSVHSVLRFLGPEVFLSYHYAFVRHEVVSRTTHAVFEVVLHFHAEDSRAEQQTNGELKHSNRAVWFFSERTGLADIDAVNRPRASKLPRFIRLLWRRTYASQRR
uniref:Putative secreted protein ovary overexpressed n=1 Tax=Rhipicephalus microplus TaxID=6941 RepID=A0A6M2DBK8_RHIMP